jgi:arylsulfatase A-like enzyme
VRHGGHDPQAAPGSAATYLCLGPGFSAAGNTPFRRHKTWVHEGGISTPFIVHWPKGVKAAGELRHTPVHLIDVVPTVLEVTGLSRPAEPAGPPFSGRSLAPLLAQDQAPERALWWLHEGNRALRLGDFKLVAARDEPWELYDLRTDRAEEKNLAAAQPEKVTDLAARWDELHQQHRRHAGAKTP